MANVQMNQSGGPGAIIINGVDFSSEVFAESVELVKVGEEPFGQIGLRFTIGLGTLELGGTRVALSDHFDEAAEKVSSIQELPKGVA